MKNKKNNKLFKNKFSFCQVREGLVRFFLILMAIIFAVLFVNVIFNNQTSIAKVHPLFLILFSTLYVGGSYLLYKVIKKYVKNEKRFVALSFVILILVQLIFAYIFVVDPTWDFGAVHNSAVSHIYGIEKITNNQYYYQYGNNIGLAVLLVMFYKVFCMVGFSHYVFLGILLNIICIDLSIFGLYKIATCYFRKEECRIFLLLSLIYTPFITYVPIFYTDTISLPFGILSIYFLVQYLEKEEHNNRDLIVSGLLLGIGCCLKFSLFIIAIALGIYLLFRKNTKKLKITIQHAALFVVVFSLPILLLNIYITLCFNKQHRVQDSFPYTHYFMIGLKDYGGFNEDDLKFTLQYKGKQAKQQANIKMIKKRLQKMMDEKKLFQFYTKKAVYTWGDGTYFAPEKLRREPRHHYKIKEYILSSNSQKNKPYHYLAQVQLVLTLLFIILGIVFRKYLTSKEQDLQLLLNIIIFGVFIFFLLWEARSRYIVNFIPILLLSCYLGIISCSRFYLQKIKRL